MALQMRRNRRRDRLEIGTINHGSRQTAYRTAIFMTGCPENMEEERKWADYLEQTVSAA